MRRDLEATEARARADEVKKYAETRPDPIRAALLDLRPALGMNEDDVRALGSLATALEKADGSTRPVLRQVGERLEDDGRIARMFLWCDPDCESGSVTRINVENGVVRSVQQGLVER